MVLHMHESNEAETDKRGELVQMRRLQERKKEKKRKTNKMEQKQSETSDIQALLSTPA